MKKSELMNNSITKQEIIKFINNLSLKKKRLFCTEKYFYHLGRLDIYYQMMELTSFLLPSAKLRERLYCLENNIKKLQVCEFCKEKPLDFVFRNDVWRYQKYCGKKCHSSFENKINENGLSLAQERALIVKKKRLNDIDEFGENSYQRSAKKSTKTMLKDIDQKGRNKFQRIALKSKKTKLETLNKEGLNIFEQTARNGSGRSKIKKYKNTNLKFQGTYEENFLERMEQFNLLHLIENGKVIKYCVDKKVYRLYFPDFESLEKNIFEIKSKWSYDKRGNDLNLRFTNNLKWKTVLENGKRFFLIWDKKYIQEVFIDDFYDLKRSLFLKDRFFSLTRENVLKIFDLRIPKRRIA